MRAKGQLGDGDEVELCSGNDEQEELAKPM